MLAVRFLFVKHCGCSLLCIEIPKNRKSACSCGVDRGGVSVMLGRGRHVLHASGFQAWAEGDGHELISPRAEATPYLFDGKDSWNTRKSRQSEMLY